MCILLYHNITPASFDSSKDLLEWCVNWSSFLKYIQHPAAKDILPKIILDYIVHLLIIKIFPVTYYANIIWI